MYIKGPNPGEPGSSGQQYFWNDLDVREAVLLKWYPQEIIAELMPGQERAVSGDSGGGIFMKIDGSLYATGVLQGTQNSGQQLFFMAIGAP